jgi:hypothetical protein
MSAEEDPDYGKDASWAKVEMTVPPAELTAFLADTALLFRLHPHLRVHDWQAQSDGSLLLSIEHEHGGYRVDTAAWRVERPSGFMLRYADGLRLTSEFTVTPHGARSALELVDRYAPASGPDDPRLIEVDRTLVPWLMAVRRYLAARRYWSWLPGWRWWHERFLPGMSPRQRRIVRLLVWTTLLEFALFVVFVAVLALRA